MSQAVQAAVLREVGGRPHVETIELRPPGPGQVRVVVEASGVCHSDLSLANGKLRPTVPVVLGHEGVGRVVETGPDVRGVRVGDRVVFNWTPPCRACWFCQHGEPYLCEKAEHGSRRPHGYLTDGTPVHPALCIGAFAEQTVVDEMACVPLAADIPSAEAALLGCAVLTGVGAVRNAAQVRAGESVLVIGLGGVGLSAVQGARLLGAGRILVVDPAPEKTQLALRLGATDVVEPGPDLAKRTRALLDGRGVDHAIECVGRAETIRAAWSATRRGGRTTVVGLGAVSDQLTFNAFEIAYFGRSLIGCMYGSADPAVELPFLLDCYRAGSLDVGSMITQQISLEEIGEALDKLAAGVGARTVVFPSATSDLLRPRPSIP